MDPTSLPPRPAPADPQLADRLLAQRRVRRLGALAVVLALTAAAGLAATIGRPGGAGAESVHVTGFHARVRGVKNWYGSYDMGELGTGWCIDPQVDHPPDPALGYAPDPVAETSDDVRTAMAWAAGRHAGGDPASVAAVTLVLHDLLARPYQGVPLVVDALDASELTEFGGAEADVVRRAREIKAEALAHQHLRGPFQLRLDAAPVAAGARGELVVTLTDAYGVGVASVPVLLAATGATLEGPAIVGTDHTGGARVPFTAAAGGNELTALAILPDTALAAFGPTLGPGQRVVVPRTVRVEARTGFEVRPPGRIVVDKHGELEAVLPVAGATFDVVPLDGSGTTRPVASLTTGADGRTPDATVAAGRYRVIERVPPPGYEVAPPRDVDVVAGETTTVDVVDRARRGQLRVTKSDGVTHDLVAGARFVLRHDTDGDGDPERVVTELTTTDVAAVVGDLLPGDYELEEVTPPAGYLPLADPVTFRIAPGASLAIDVPNAPWTTAAFQKRPADDPGGRLGGDPDFAGAVFVVRGPVRGGDDPDTAGEVGRCTTGPEGRCQLPPRVLRPGSRYCWEEVAAPAGWGRAAPGCFVAADAVDPAVVVVVEEPRSSPPTTSPPTTSPPTTSPPTTGPPSTRPPTDVPTTPPPTRPAPATPPGRPPATTAPPPTLPRTGASVTWPAGSGLALLAGGTLLTRWSRRRVA